MIICVSPRAVVAFHSFSAATSLRSNLFVSWKSSEELKQQFDSMPEIDQLGGLAALWEFWTGVVFPEDYQADESWSQAIVLTESGAAVASGLDAMRQKSPNDFSLAMFLKFYHQDLFIDWRKTDTRTIENLLSAELSVNRVKLPYRFGRCLYDRFNDLYFITRTDHLLPADTRSLLEGTPDGIYQVDNLLSGPLGLIQSREKRFIPPSLTIPLWHCSDTGCPAFHAVEFLRPKTALVNALDEVERHLDREFGPPSEWASGLEELHHRDARPNGRPYYDLPMLISDCVIAEERVRLLAAALAGPESKELRSLIGNVPRRKQDAVGPPGEVAAKLSTEEQLQLLMTLPDRRLVELLDDLTAESTIDIPIGECRKAREAPPRGSNYDSTSELSALGARSYRGNPCVNLVTAVLRASEAENLANELKWRLGSDTTGSPDKALVEYLRSNGPKATVNEIVLSSAAITRILCTELQVRLSETGDKEKLAQRLLWKLGFDPVRFDQRLQRCHDRLDSLRDILLGVGSIDTESDRERIRAVGVNLFVSLEELLSDLLCFNVWLLASDHFADTEFTFDRAEALVVVAETLGNEIDTGEEKLSWSSNGENSLGVLLAYLQRSANWMLSLSEGDRADLRRPEADLPHFADDERRKFPFLHRALWADADPAQLRRFVDGYRSIVTLLGQADLASIRNGLDHFREASRFPKVDAMLACVARIEQAVQKADIERFFPKIWWVIDLQQDRNGQGQLVFGDYAERRLVHYKPSLISGLKKARTESPFVIAPGDLLGTPNSQLLFATQRKTEYSAYWEGYPRRRRVPPDKPNNSGHGHALAMRSTLPDHSQAQEAARQAPRLNASIP